MDKSLAPIFISYARSDSSAIAPILEYVRSHGYRLWIDEEGIEGATFWRREIVEAIVRAPLVIFFASDRSCASHNVAKELALASDEHKSILPVLLHEVSITPELRYQIAGLQYVLYFQDEERARKQLIAALSRLVHPPVTPVAHVSSSEPSTDASATPVYSERAASILSSAPKLIESLDSLQRHTQFLWDELCRLDAYRTEFKADIMVKTFEKVRADLEHLVSLGHLRYSTKDSYTAVSTGEPVLEIHVSSVTTQLANLAKAINSK